MLDKEYCIDMVALKPQNLRNEANVHFENFQERPSHRFSFCLHTGVLIFFEAVQIQHHNNDHSTYRI